MPTGANSVNSYQKENATTKYNNYVEGLEQSLYKVKEYTVNINTTTMTDAEVGDLKEEIVAQRKQTADILAQNNKMMEAMMKMGATAEAGTTAPMKKHRVQRKPGQCATKSPSTQRRIVSRTQIIRTNIPRGTRNSMSRAL